MNEEREMKADDPGSDLPLAEEPDDDPPTAEEPDDKPLTQPTNGKSQIFSMYFPAQGGGSGSADRFSKRRAAWSGRTQATAEHDQCAPSEPCAVQR